MRDCSVVVALLRSLNLTDNPPNNMILKEQLETPSTKNRATKEQFFARFGFGTNG